MNIRTYFVLLSLISISTGCTPVPESFSPTIVSEFIPSATLRPETPGAPENQTPTIAPTSSSLPLLTSTSTPLLTLSPIVLPTSTATETTQPRLHNHPPLIAVTMLTQDGKEAIHTINPDGTGLTLLDLEPEDSYGSVWSPDGQMLAYLSGNPDEAVWLSILDFESGVVQLVDYPVFPAFTWAPSGVSLESPAFIPFDWSPDGQKLVFTSWPGDNQESSSEYNVYILSVDSFKFASIYKLPETKRILDFDWSPAGDQILAMFDDARYPTTYLRLYSLAGGYITPEINDFSVYSASWDPKGEWIAFSSMYLSEQGLWLLSADGKLMRDLVQNQNVLNHNWSPDGKQIAYSSSYCSYGNPSSISIIDVQSMDVIQIVPSSAFACNPMWSPDGDYLSFTTATEDASEKGFALNIYSFATGETTQIIPGMVSEGGSWRP